MCSDKHIPKFRKKKTMNTTNTKLIVTLCIKTFLIYKLQLSPILEWWLLFLYFQKKNIKISVCLILSGQLTTWDTYRWLIIIFLSINTHMPDIYNTFIIFNFCFHPRWDL